MTTVPREAWAYVEGVAGDGEIADRNRADWRRWSIVPRVFATPREVDPSVEVLGIRSSFPLFIAPTAANGLGHLDAEVAVATAARHAGVPIVLSQAASRDVEDVAAAAGAYLQQIYLPEDRSALEPFLDRVRVAGARALVLTVDQPASPWVHPFRRDAFTAEPFVRPSRPPLAFGEEGARAATPSDIAWLSAYTGLPVLAKGVLHPDDALIALDAGAAGIVVSNHGGRQIGGSITSARALPRVADAVDGRAPVLVDSGVTDEDDIFRAVALGADAVLIGRPIIRALWDEGESAVHSYLIDLRDAFENVLRLSGYADVAALRAVGLSALDGPPPVSVLPSPEHVESREKESVS